MLSTAFGEANKDAYQNGRLLILFAVVSLGYFDPILTQSNKVLTVRKGKNNMRLKLWFEYPCVKMLVRGLCQECKVMLKGLR
jgi:hypothetical protein